ncbi:MAG: radical SAM protein [Gammaproteobacteria bacterium]|nr:radical SAM protein [Gammaproteobacteria bacterium]
MLTRKTANLTAEEIKDWRPDRLLADGLTPLERARRRMEMSGQWAPWQAVGRRMAIGCVALEVSQRCNLDCTYCYLSESSEALRDIPIEEVFRRVDMIFAHYGAGTDIQVTGGDPTLRKRDELLAIVRYIKSKGMRASLFTNGIKATRGLLEDLCEAGLEDIAFHVDLTQERKGYRTEAELNAVRQAYIERARGLPLSVFFNTTAYPGNIHEMPAVVRFFIDNCDVVRLCSFQIGADTGRGTERARVTVNSETVIDAISQGCEAKLNFGAASAGHSACNRYAYGLVCNGRVYDFFNDPAFVHEMLAATAHLQFDRADKRRAIEAMSDFLLRNPRLLAGFASRAAKTAWRGRRDLFKARGKVGKLSFFVHNFMDACHLDRERAEACSFMVMTPQGPMSMCVHNAKRDDYLLVPAEVKTAHKVRFFNPATGKLEDEKPERITVSLTRKNARGRAREGLEARARK